MFWSSRNKHREDPGLWQTCQHPMATKSLQGCCPQSCHFPKKVAPTFRVGWLACFNTPNWNGTQRPKRNLYQEAIFFSRESFHSRGIAWGVLQGCVVTFLELFIPWKWCCLLRIFSLTSIFLKKARSLCLNQSLNQHSFQNIFCVQLDPLRNVSFLKCRSHMYDYTSTIYITRVDCIDIRYAIYKLYLIYLYIYI